MYMRLGFAIAAHIDADVLLLDEVFAVGDEQFQRNCFTKIFEFKQAGGTIVFVSHDAAAVERLCDRATCSVTATSSSTARRTTRSFATGSCSPASWIPPSAGRPEGWGTGDARIDDVELLKPGR